jgi:hypothetical protein
MTPADTTTPEIAGAALGSGTSKITNTPGPSAAVLIHRDQLATGSFDEIFGRLIAIGGGIFHYVVNGLHGVLPC